MENEQLSQWMVDGESRFLPLGVESLSKQREKPRIIHVVNVLDLKTSISTHI